MPFSICKKIKQIKIKKQQKKLLEPASSISLRAEEIAKAVSSEPDQILIKLADNNLSADERSSLVVAAAELSLGLKPYVEQIAGSSTLLERAVSEMQTGEGKTLTAAMGAAIHALEGKKVHVATVNDYLAGRDAEKLKPFFETLGLTVAHASAVLTPEQKKSAYNADIVYATAQELGFDYLRDHLVDSASKAVQRGLDVVIIDEIDSVLIDEAGTPLVLSGEPQSDGGLYKKLIDLVETLSEGEHYSLDRKELFVDITDEGFNLIESKLVEEELIGPGETLHQSQNLALAHSVSSALAAVTLYRKDIEYMVKDGEIIIVDEHTGRALRGRRWSDGLHQAIEAKEGMEVKADPPQLASITYQSFFSLYRHVCGLTGTARSAQDEFERQYGLKVVSIPTHRPVQRKDEFDVVYATAAERDKAVIEEVIHAQKKKQPVLIGTSSVEASEALAESLRSAGIKPAVLNAKNHEKEAEIIADAGRPGAVTIATQMAGRGTDILLGGSLESALEKAPGKDRHQAIRDRWADDQQAVIEAGGLYVIGTSRAPSRRVDRQLRGRAGRQGDPGLSRFFLSFEDEFIKTFAGDKLEEIAGRFDVSEGEALEGKMIDRIVYHAQKTRENIDQSVRMQLVKFDSAIANQRAIIYKVREEWLAAFDSEDSDSIRKDMIDKCVEASVDKICDRYLPEDPLLAEKVNTEPMVKAIAKNWNLALAPDFFQKFEKEPEKLRDYMLAMARAYYDHRVQYIRPDILPLFEKSCLLEGLDRAWQYQQRRLDALRDGINLRSFANENPTVAFQKEAAILFETVFDEAREISGEVLLGANIPGKKPVEQAA